MIVQFPQCLNLWLFISPFWFSWPWKSWGILGRCPVEGLQWICVVFLLIRPELSVIWNNTTEGNAFLITSYQGGSNVHMESVMLTFTFGWGRMCQVSCTKTMHLFFFFHCTIFFERYQQIWPNLNGKVWRKDKNSSPPPGSTVSPYVICNSVKKKRHFFFY